MKVERQMRNPDPAGVARAAEKVAQILPFTPLLPVKHAGQRFWLKAECLQQVGAFRIRGAWHRASSR
jgi:threonine dehydratase